MTEGENNFRGNPHHLSKLLEAVQKKDIGLWNNYVRKNGSSFRARLAGADLSGLSMPEIRLDGADLTDSDLSQTNLSRANLSNARLRGCILFSANLSGARLNHTDFTNADLRKAEMTNVRARGAVLNGANLSEAVMDGADLSKSTMSGAAVTGISRSGTRMKVRVKVKSSSGNSWKQQSREQSGNYRPWIKAREEEDERKTLRKQREELEAEKAKVMLERKLGRRKPLFNRVK